MKKTLFAIVVALLLLFSCNNFGSPDYTVTITLGPGTYGIPAAGTYTHQEFDVIEYSYGALEGAAFPEVKINDKLYQSWGSVTVYSTLKIDVYQRDIRKTFHFTLTLDSTDIYNFDLTFAGDSLISGTFTDSYGHHGDWLMTGENITITYQDWYDFVLTGAVSTWTGSWTGNSLSGTWSAEAAT